MLAKDKIKAFRKQKGLTLTEFARLIDVSQGNVSRYENGSVRKIPDQVLVRISKALGCTVSDLVKDDPAYVHLQNVSLSLASANNDQLLLEWYHTRSPEVQSFIMEHVQHDMKNVHSG